MTFEEALREELSSISGITNKIYPLTAKKGTKAPYLIYVSSEGIQDKVFQGYLDSKEIACEVNIVHSTYENMKSLSKLVIEKIVSFQGRTIGTNGPTIKNVTYQKPVELFEREIQCYRCVIEIKVRI